MSEKERYVFKPSEDDKDFCERCGNNFRNPIHLREGEREQTNDDQP